MSQESVKKALMDMLQLDESTWDPDLRLHENLGLDSLAKIRVVKDLARAYGHESTAPAMLRAETAGALLELLQDGPYSEE